MLELHKIAIVSIGSEITTGQILNSNAAWLAHKIQEKGLSTVVHLSVPDDRPLIQEAYHFCRNLNCSLIITTGGLGPTSDDFTRETISSETLLPLIWNEASWQKIKELLKSRGREAKEIQKQQCYFPEGAEVLINPEGTANGFYLNATPPGGEFIALPGPPAEIQALWNLYLDSWFTQRSTLIDKTTIHSWNFKDIPESELALLVEPIFQNSPFTLGYRLHKPFVEFKIIYRESQKEILLPYLEKVEKIFASLDKIVKP